MAVNSELQEFSRTGRLSITFCLLYTISEKVHSFHLCTQPETQLLLIDKTNRCAHSLRVISQGCSIYQAKVAALRTRTQHCHGGWKASVGAVCPSIPPQQKQSALPIQFICQGPWNQFPFCGWEGRLFSLANWHLVRKGGRFQFQFAPACAVFSSQLFFTDCKGG